MTEYDARVERQRLLLEAEDWANGVRSLHSHRLKSMWYDTRPQDTDNGQYVIDKQYNGSEIERSIYDAKGKYLGTFIFGKRLTGDDLVNEYRKHST